MDVMEAVSHPSYSDWTLDNDIALIRTKTPMILDSTTAKAISLPEQDSDVPEEQMVTITGWGFTTQNSGQKAPILQKIEIPVISRTVCRQLYKDYNLVTDNMFCAGIAPGGVDACQVGIECNLFDLKKLKQISQQSHGLVIIGRFWWTSGGERPSRRRRLVGLRQHVRSTRLLWGLHTNRSFQGLD